MELCVIDESDMKWDEMRANWKDKWKVKGETLGKVMASH